MFNCYKKITTLPWVLLVCLILGTDSKDLPCYSCSDMGHPRFCQHIDYCSSDEVCGITKTVAPSGEIKFHSGCLLRETCPQNQRRRTDVTTCTECCNTELCNNKGCGDPGITVSTGPVCYHCTGITNPKDCKTIEICKSDEACFVEEKLFFNEVMYDLQCRNKHICTAIDGVLPVVGRRKRTVHCTKCCYDNLCNTNCDQYIFTTSTSSALLTSRKFDPSTPSTTTPLATTTLTATQNPKRGSHGKSFVVTFIENLSKNKPQLIYIMSHENMDGTCNLMSPYNSLKTTLNIRRNTATLYNVSQSLELTAGKSHKGIFIKCDIDVTVTALNEEEMVTDGFLVLPITMLGTEYIVPSYTSYTDQSIAGIVSPYNNTDITVDLRLMRGYFTYNGVNYRNGSKLRLTMEALDAFQISVERDISGTYIKSSKPVAVVSGDFCADVQGGGCSHLSEMILPVNYFSKLFIVPMLKKGYLAKVRAFSNTHSRIVLTSRQNTNQTITIANQNYKEFNYNDTFVASASDNILFQLYCNAGSADGFMMTVPGIQQYLNSYIFYVPDQFNSSLSFIIKASEVNGLRIDGKPLARISMRNVTVTGVQYSTFSYDVLHGMHKAEHLNDIPFALLVYGYKLGDGYGYLAGIGQ